MFGSLQSFGGLNGIRRALPGLAALLLATHAAWAQQSKCQSDPASAIRLLVGVLKDNKLSLPSRK
jgi:hypothetical protein